MRIGLYLADQVWARTKSKGIYSYSRTLVAELVRRLEGHEIVLIVNDSNRQDLVPLGRTPALIVELPAVCAGGVARLGADHLAAPYLARRLRLDLIHFPKGFTPWFSCAPALVTATIHDTIPLFYERHYPGYVPAAKLRYLRSMFLNSLRRAHGILTDSHFSRTALLELAKESGLTPPPIEVCEIAPDPQLTADDGEPARAKGETRILHLGSVLPHKRTRETIHLFRTFNRARGRQWRLCVTGLVRPPTAWQIEPEPDLEFLGPLSPGELRREFQRARALLLLSSIEGFGLPALEAWFLGTPVCYSTGGSLPEILEGVPGRCPAPCTQPEFEAALDEILALDASDLATYRDRLRKRFSVEAFGERVAALFRGWLPEVRA